MLPNCFPGDSSNLPSLVMSTNVWESLTICSTTLSLADSLEMVESKKSGANPLTRGSYLCHSYVTGQTISLFDASVFPLVKWEDNNRIILHRVFRRTESVDICKVSS